MAKTIVQFTLPFVFVDEGEYEVSKEGKVAKVKIVHEQNDAMMEKVMGVKSGGDLGSKTTMTPDQYGIANVSRVTVELPYLLPLIETKGELSNADINAMIERLSGSLSLKRECVLYLNRLGEVIRWKTRKYWIKSVSERDILGWSCFVVDDAGKTKMDLNAVDFGKGLTYPLNVVEESSVRSDILNMLKNETKVPLPDIFFLDAVNYFVSGRFNEAVIVANIALEIQVAEHLAYKLKERGVPDEEVGQKVSNIFGDGLHHVMKKYFKEVDGRSLEEEKELWKKFDDARLMRKHTMHPHTRKLSEIETRKTLDDILEIIKWIIYGVKP